MGYDLDVRMTLQKHLQNPRNAGEIKAAHGAGEAGSAACGAVIRIHLRFRDGKIADASFQASGTVAVIAAGSILTDAIKGKSWQEAAACGVAGLRDLICDGGVERDADGKSGAGLMIDGNKAAQVAQFSIEALHLALEDSFRRGNFPVAAQVDTDTVVVAMSGGVDSSMACLMEKNDGRKVIGVTMRLDAVENDEDGNGSESGFSCCSPRAIQEARALCHSLGIPHLTLDFTGEFEKLIISSFISEYLAGHTPNPCVRCNAALRFPALVAVADCLGAGKVATGHYARLVGREGKIHLARGRDRKKDQSYMLSAVGSGLLPRLEFPLGELEKEETRELALKAGITAYNRPESQDICFIHGNDYRAFLRQRSDFNPAAGDVVDSEGRKLGTHAGYIDYTVGQRRGLGLSARSPMYVLGTEPDRNRVVVGSRDELNVSRIWIEGVNILAPPGDFNDLEIQVRYNSRAVSGAVIKREGDRWLVGLNAPVHGVAPGQTAVIYRGEEVVAGGVIQEAGA